MINPDQFPPEPGNTSDQIDESKVTDAMFKGEQSQSKPEKFIPTAPDYTDPKVRAQMERETRRSAALIVTVMFGVVAVIVILVWLAFHFL